MSDDTPEQLFQKWLTNVKTETQNYNKLVGKGGATRTSAKKVRKQQYLKWRESHIDAWGTIPKEMMRAGVTKESNPDLFNVLDKVANKKKITRAEVVAVFGGEKKAKSISAVKTALSALGFREMEEGEVDEGVQLAPKGLENIDVGSTDGYTNKIGKPDYNMFGPKETAQIEDAYKRFKNNIQPAPATVAPTPAPAPATTETEEINAEIIKALESYKKGDDGKWKDDKGETVPDAKIKELLSTIPDNPALNEKYADVGIPTVKATAVPESGAKAVPSAQATKLRGGGKKKTTAQKTTPAKLRSQTKAEEAEAAKKAEEAEEEKEEEKEDDEADAEEIQDLYGEPEQPPTVDVVPPPTVPAGPAEFTQDLPPVVNIPDEGPTTLPAGLRQEFIQEGDRSAPADLQTGMGGIGETIAQLNDKEQRDVMKMKLPEIKKRIEALHIAYDSLIPEFKANAHTKTKNDALRTKDIKVARKHLIKMLQRVQAYYDANTALKVGVIVPANILMRQLFENKAMMNTIVDPNAPTVPQGAGMSFGSTAERGEYIFNEEAKLLSETYNLTLEEAKDIAKKQAMGWTFDRDTMKVNPPQGTSGDPIQLTFRTSEGGDDGEDQRRRLVDFQTFLQNPTVQALSDRIMGQLAQMGQKQLDSALKNAQTGVKESIMKRLEGYTGGSSTDPPTDAGGGTDAGTGGGGSGGIPMGTPGMGMGGPMGGMPMGASTVNQNVKPHAGDTLHVKGDKFGHAMSVSTYYRNSGMEAFQRRGVARHSITPQPERRTRFNIVKDPRPLPNVPAPAIGVLNNRARGKPTGFKIRT